ncbi:MAG TPA: hypothetical protein VJU16_00845 [Planctomycetota bacterium]|nr:hypothetical protein [Planctomycetota bacterium]
MRRGIFRFTVVAALAGALGACEGSVNDDENFFVLTFRASLDPGGTELTGPSERPQITPDGRYVVFQTRAAGLDPDPAMVDNNGKFDIYRKDLQTGTVVRVSIEGSNILDSDGTRDPGDNCVNPSITPDGRFVVFESTAIDIVENAGGLNKPDIFLRDLTSNDCVWISLPDSGITSNGEAGSASISDDGRYVAFHSSASNLVPIDANGTDSDVFVRDTVFGTTALISKDVNGVQASGGGSFNPSISGDGLRVAFDSDASNLVIGDVASRDVFIKDWLGIAPTVSRVSAEGPGDLNGDADLVNTNGDSFQPSVSQDGRFVAFISAASNLVVGDNNEIGGQPVEDIYVRDTALGITSRASLSTRGGEPSQHSRAPQISRNGRWVTFNSTAPDLVPDDRNNADDVFLRDTVAGTTIRISVATYGIESAPFFDSRAASITGDGRFVAFTSLAPNLAPNDTNGTSDIFIRGPLY